MLLPTLAEVLELPAVRRGDPAVRAGAAHLDRPVRWGHVSEGSDIAHLLEGGELILTTGIALPESPSALATYVDELAAVGVSAVAVELGRRYRTAPAGAGPAAGGTGRGRRYRSALPPDLVEAAERAGLPLVELRRETPFVA